MHKSEISIIGAGALGSTLAKTLYDNGFAISGVFSKTKAKAEALSVDVEAKNGSDFPVSLKSLGQICFICVPDDSIAPVAERIAELEDDLSDTAFVHTSGALPADILNILSKRGALIASFHPLMTFDGTYSGDDFNKTYVSLQGDGGLVTRLEYIAEAMGARSIIVNPKQKAALHRSAVFACNYLVALMEAAEESLRLDDTDIDLIEVMGPLISKTLENIMHKGMDDSLTGPISRGDAGTVRQHLKGLKPSPVLTDVYTGLGKAALQIAQRRGLDEDKVRNIRTILENTTE